VTAEKPFGADAAVRTLDGQLIPARSATIFLDADEVTKIDLELRLDKMDVVAQVDVVTLKCPLCEHEATHDCPPNRRELTLGGD